MEQGGRKSVEWLLSRVFPALCDEPYLTVDDNRTNLWKPLKALMELPDTFFKDEIVMSNDLFASVFGCLEISEMIFKNASHREILNARLVGTYTYNALCRLVKRGSFRLDLGQRGGGMQWLRNNMKCSRLDSTSFGFNKVVVFDGTIGLGNTSRCKMQLNAAPRIIWDVIGQKVKSLTFIGTRLVGTDFSSGMDWLLRRSPELRILRIEQFNFMNVKLRPLLSNSPFVSKLEILIIAEAFNLLRVGTPISDISSHDFLHFLSRLNSLKILHFVGGTFGSKVETLAEALENGYLHQVHFLEICENLLHGQIGEIQIPYRGDNLTTLRIMGNVLAPMENNDSTLRRILKCISKKLRIIRVDLPLPVNGWVTDFSGIQFPSLVSLILKLKKERYDPIHGRFDFNSIRMMPNLETFKCVISNHSRPIFTYAEMNATHMQNRSDNDQNPMLNATSAAGTVRIRLTHRLDLSSIAYLVRMFPRCEALGLELDDRSLLEIVERYPGLARLRFEVGSRVSERAIRSALTINPNVVLLDVNVR